MRISNLCILKFPLVTLPLISIALFFGLQHSLYGQLKCRANLIAGGLNAGSEGVHGDHHGDDRVGAVLGQHLCEDGALQRPVDLVLL